MKKGKLFMKKIIALSFFSLFFHSLLASSTEDLVRLVQAYRQAEQYEEAAQTLALLIEQDPRNLQYLFDIAYIYNMIGREDDALSTYQTMLELVPHNISILYNIAFTLKSHGKLAKAIELYHQIIALSPDYEQAHFGLARTLLQQGSFKQGWHEYEWCLKKVGRNTDELRNYLATNTIAGKKIVLYPEGGLGDTLQFVRFAQSFKELGAHVTVIAQKPLIPLLKSCPYIDQLYGTNLCPVHYHSLVTMMNAPAVLNTEEHEIPQPPYLFADPALISAWQPLFENDTTKKIGICWQADVHNDSSRPPVARRGIPLKLLAQTLNKFSQTTFYSLQQKDGLEQLADIPAGFNLHTFDNNFDNDHGPFMDSAAVMMHLDCIITVDTAIAHLAGALNKKVILLLPYNIDWRWIVGRTDSPWYPSMTIIQQPRPFDWDSVMIKLEQHLATLY